MILAIYKRIILLVVSASGPCFANPRLVIEKDKFFIAQTRRRLKKHTNIERLTRTACVLLTVAKVQLEEDKKRRITPRHILFGVKQDADFKKLSAGTIIPWAGTYVATEKKTEEKKVIPWKNDFIALSSTTSVRVYWAPSYFESDIGHSRLLKYKNICYDSMKHYTIEFVFKRAF